ncbi:MAG: PQQ-dependent sugar dehydrogenase [Planctomycetota bacterium]
MRWAAVNGRRTWSRGLLLVGMISLAFGSTVRAELPDGFERTVIAEGLCQPTSVAAAPDGRIFIALLEGTIYSVVDGVFVDVPILQLDVTVANEQGLVELLLDREFETNGYLYAFYTSNEVKNRVSRFTVVGNSIDPASEVVLWENTPSLTVIHQGGGLAMLPDGSIVIGTGDQGQSPSAQQLNGMNGKLLRVNNDGTIPADNPFVGLAGFEPRLWSIGVRNPYRLHYDDVEGELWMGDVGSSGGNASEEINLAEAGGNYGWDDQEGADCFVSDCAEFIPPLFVYGHDDPTYATATLNACVILGPRYRGTSFPAQYQGNLFYGDWSGKWIRRLVFDGTGNIVDDLLFDSAPDAGDVVDFAETADGGLVVAMVGVPWCLPPDDGKVYRIDWVGIPPQPVVESSARTGPAPLEVAFISDGTTDPDASPLPLTYFWTFGDGSSSSGPNPTHTYTAEGSYLAKLTVTDGQYAVESSVIEIVVGDPPRLLRGDCNDDLSVDLGDAIGILTGLFGSGPPASCEDACDANNDGELNLADAVTLLTALFGGPGGTLPHPHGACGYDHGIDGLDCSAGSCP